MTHTNTLLHRVKNHPTLISFLSVATFIALLCFAFEPRWQSNDDVAMSMIAHGYGLAAYGSPQLFNSNILWGYLVRAIPSINGVLGYSLATLATLLVIAWSMLYFLLRLGAGYLTGLLVVALLIARPVLFPQFTINAGLLTVAAIVGWQVYAKVGGKGNLVLACALAFFGYLIRDKEFLLVLGVALPLLPWRAMRVQQPLQVAFLLLGVSIASAFVFDHWIYSTPEWQNFSELSPARTPLRNFLDFGAGDHLKQHPEILAQHHYSLNDIELIKNWFIVDPQIANPRALNAMLTELDSISMQSNGIQSGLFSLKALFDPVLLPLLLLALILLALMPSRSVVFAWVLCLAALFTIGLFGRPGMLRIYIPLVSLLFVLPIALGTCRKNIQQWGISLMLFLACAANAFVFIPQVMASDKWVKQVQKDIRGIPPEPIVSWGNSFPFELAFPLLASDALARNIKLFGLDSFTRAPYSIANAEQIAGRGMLKRLQTTDGIPIMASPQFIEALRIYCGEHLNGQLYEMAMLQTSWLLIRRVRCESGR